MKQYSNKNYGSVTEMQGSKKPGFFKKPNQVGFLGFIGFFGQAGKNR